jgi:hypothetical protein
MPVTKLPTPDKHAEVGKSPRVERFGLWSKDVIVKSIAVGGAQVPAVLYEGTLLQKATNGNYYAVGVAPPGGITLTTPAEYCVLQDKVDVTGIVVGSGLSTTAYFSGNFLTTFLKIGAGVTLASITHVLRTQDIYWEHASAVVASTEYGT